MGKGVTHNLARALKQNPIVKTNTQTIIIQTEVDQTPCKASS